ncbi:hypothetical protein L228DRAFT_239847 [Xylona heveae TC161]|uniref:Letm1 RBD domain-containing protein n=1 Tax=Xylona heveae (strain CBS 132557 / TC161) TaxID=1328760 RepID=A0A165G9U7_XYLHT|nr:hypothetical protein L228DRAFT_239847 [Xylona heveae TC161]KZF21921.1 hypothetical protein L228DRAFT_239847 [Xylona heveae TC161]
MNSNAICGVRVAASSSSQATLLRRLHQNHSTTPVSFFDIYLQSSRLGRCSQLYQPRRYNSSAIAGGKRSSGVAVSTLVSSTRSSRRNGVITTAFKTNAAPYATSTTLSRADKVNPPASTRAPELVLNERQPDQSQFSFLFQRGRTYLNFYKDGLKAIWTNWNLTRPINASIAESGYKTPADAARAGVLTRSQYQLLHRTSYDLKRLFAFGGILLVFGEFTPFIVPFVPALVPGTCKFDSLVQGERAKLELRRRESFRHIVAPLPKLESESDSKSEVDRDAVVQQDAKTNKTNNDRLLSAVDRLSSAQLLHISNSLNLHSRLYPVSPPTALLRYRVRKYLADYLAVDDLLIRKCGGVSPMNIDEVKRSLAERGVDVLGRKESDLRETLRRWLSLTASKEDVVLELLLARPSVWPSSSHSSSSSTPSTTAQNSTARQ